MNLQMMMKFLFRMGVKGVGLALYDKNNHGMILTWSTNYDLNKYTCRYMPLSFAYSHAMIQQNDRSKKPIKKMILKNDHSKNWAVTNALSKKRALKMTIKKHNCKINLSKMTFEQTTVRKTDHSNPYKKNDHRIRPLKTWPYTNDLVVCSALVRDWWRFVSTFLITVQLTIGCTVNWIRLTENAENDQEYSLNTLEFEQFLISLTHPECIFWGVRLPFLLKNTFFKCWVP